MNNTKWEELRLGMHGLGKLSPKFRVRNLRSQRLSEWDGEWFHHFYGSHAEDEWVEIAVISSVQREAVLKVLRSVHVPGAASDTGFKVFGYVPLGTPVEYL
ncbi:hypothetical protein QTH89_23365 [Variovorax sp. J22G21]|uniref:DUF6678 family protein n=1 Tax=Variovorax fucosicus TaxID=3053517 RepID=UPI0025755A05|nr:MULTISPECIES: DUF6678 family protein [unclassified Variovorax]MDM0039397.1 hypothetical protein [Variovorax sp. J22R193]MDM0054986.1 hypothetical protein [Variovorax sp. J22G47]MDM0064172.1 hypothetical protein [Variovorax sp. J22G21]